MITETEYIFILHLRTKGMPLHNHKSGSVYNHSQAEHCLYFQEPSLQSIPYLGCFVMRALENIFIKDHKTRKTVYLLKVNYFYFFHNLGCWRQWQQNCYLDFRMTTIMFIDAIKPFCKDISTFMWCIEHSYGQPYLQKTAKTSAINPIPGIHCGCYIHPGINSLWLSDAIGHHRTWSALVQAVVCGLTTPSNYRNKCWLINREILWNSHGNFTGKVEDIDQRICCKFIQSKWSHRVQWVNYSPRIHCGCHMEPAIKVMYSLVLQPGVSACWISHIKAGQLVGWATHYTILPRWLCQDFCANITVKINELVLFCISFTKYINSQDKMLLFPICLV